MTNSVHDETQLAERQEVDVFQQVLDELDVGDVAGQFAVVDRLAGYLAVQQGKVNLRQVVAFHVNRLHRYNYISMEAIHRRRVSLEKSGQTRAK